MRVCWVLALLVSLVIACDGPAHGPASDPGFSQDAKLAMVEGIRAERAKPRHPSDGGGRAWLVGGGSRRTFRAGSFQRLHFIYETGAEGIAEGGTIWLLISPFWGWDRPQVHAPDERGYVTVRTDAEGVQLEPEVPNPRRWRLAIRVTGRPLHASERVHIVYGAGPGKARVDSFAEREAPHRFAVDGDGDGVHALLSDEPSVDVVASAPARLILALPGTARPGEPVGLTVAVLDRIGNAGTNFVGEVQLLEAGSGLAFPERIPFGPEDRGIGRVEGIAPGAGVHRIRAMAVTSSGEPLSSDASESNPMVVSAEGPRLLWGDLHGHSHYSDGTGTPEDYFRFARDAAGLDVAVLTDHDHWGVRSLEDQPALWEDIRRAVRQAHEPGRFVTLLGFEWTSWLHGHRHVLYFRDQGPVLSWLDPETETPDELWRALRGHNALTFAHHSAGGPISTNWNFVPPADIEPVTEIVSSHGSSEAADSPVPIENPVKGGFVRDVLDRGVQLGFVGSGDGHDGHPGLAQIRYRSGGLAGLWASNLNREAIRQALLARNVYATNGARIVLWTALDGRPMGSAVEPPVSPQHELRIRVVGTAPIAKVELVRRGQGPVSVFDGDGHREWSGSVSVPILEGADYLYARVLQEDGGAAWSSPFFAVQAEASRGSP